METVELIMVYWRSWQSHSNWETTRKLMADDFKLDAGIFKTENADQLIEMMKMGNPWKDIELLDFIVEGNKGAIIYEGTDSVTEARIRVSEIVTIKDNKVASAITNITQLTTS